MSLADRPNGPQTIAASSSSQSGLNVQASLASVLPALQVLAVTTETVILNPENTAIALIVPLPPNMPSLEQTPFDLWISGYIKTTNSTNLTLKVYSGTSTTVGSDTSLATSGAIAQNTATAPFWIHLRLIYDSVSGKLLGSFEFLLNGTVVGATTLSNTVTGVSNANNPVLNFLLSLTSSAASGSNPTTINVQKFSVG